MNVMEAGKCHEKETQVTSSLACLFSSLNATVVAFLYDEKYDEIYMISFGETMRKRQRC